MGLLGLMIEWIKDNAKQDSLGQLTDQQLKDIGLNRDEVTGLRTGMFGS